MIEWPGKKCTFCGDLIHKRHRICNENSLNPEGTAYFHLKVCFGSNNYCGENFERDIGLPLT
jgi:hypothetical protein